MINPQFDGAFTFAEHGLARVEQNGKYGYINKKGTYAINPQFDFAYPYFYEDGYTVVSLGSKSGVIDTAGRYVVNPTLGFYIRGLKGI